MAATTKPNRTKGIAVVNETEGVKESSESGFGFGFSIISTVYIKELSSSKGPSSMLKPVSTLICKDWVPALGIAQVKITSVSLKPEMPETNCVSSTLAPKNNCT